RARCQGAVSRSARRRTRRRRQRSDCGDSEPQVIAGRAAIVVTLFAATLLARSAAAQSQSLPGTLELAIGTVWSGAQSLGSRDANLSTGTGGTLRLFSSRSEEHTSELQSLRHLV